MSAQVTAAVLVAPGRYELQEFPRPELPDGSLLMQMEMSGICGTDKHTYLGETKQYAGTDVVSHLFDWDSLPLLGAEARLSQLCRWVLDAHSTGEAYGLRLPGLVIEPNMGPAHRERCLNALALFEESRGTA